MVDTLRQELSKLLIVEDLEGTARWDLAHSGGVEAVVVIAVAGLHEDGRVRQTFGIHFPSHVVEMDSFSNVSSCVFNCRISVNIGQQP